MSKAPIILFVYNRPDHTLRTLKALENNNLASESELFIYADAAKNEQSKAAVEQVREIISRNWRFKAVTLTLRESNCGLAANVIDGVTKIVKQYGQVIVLEDDLVTSPFALQYFNDALELYRHQDQVMQISGYGYPVKDIETLPETFFFRVANSWGWATWDRAWNRFNSDINTLTDDFTAEQIHQFSIEGKENFWKQVKEFKAGKINSWAIRWYASVFKNNGLVLYPRNSLTQNIGNDGSGTHTAAETTYQVVLANKKITQFPQEIQEHAQAYQSIKYFYAHRKGSLLQRGIRFAKKKLNELKK
ncbi:MULTISPECIES: glycosyltransferase [Sphingobacterium]|uniref:glycosyltransferase n=1 Tax=Sphingobacterium TaxID=28453 RepID=UPI00104557CD|nr:MULTISPECIES: glycosyltransferase [Sphingobacterium]MCW2261973.1 hypothetical protein [Sphingobacterium kitahiroshimense]NJI75068.1 glycosyltransferase [Sphingobacterium sp. B16(2022)]TCR13278.1 glycosyl transferase family 2 [Sphingobacterium sp. JUb78]